MFSGIILFFALILFFGFFVVYKRDMLVKLFSLNVAAPVGEFQQELERTADAALRRLETQIAHLELLLDEADAKIELLDQKLQAMNQAEESLAAVSPAPATIAPAAVPVLAPITATPPAVARAVDVYLPPEPPPPVIAPPPAEEQPVREPMSGDRRKLILTMADQGYSVTEIAKATNTGKGEIMLLLQLNKK